MERKIFWGVFAICTLCGFGYGVKYVFEWRAETEIRKHLDGAVSSLSAFVDVSYQDVRVNAFRQSVEIAGIQAKLKFSEGGWSLPLLRVSDFDHDFVKKAIFGQLDRDSRIPTSMRLELIGTEIPFESLPTQMQEDLRKIGYKKITLSTMNYYRLNKAAAQMDFEFGYRLHGACEVVMSASLGSVPFDLFTEFHSNPGAKKDPKAMAALMEMTIRKLEIKYTDASLVSRLNWLLYHKEKTTFLHEFNKVKAARTARRAQNQADREVASAAAVLDPATQAAMDAVQSFLDSPKSFSILAQPENPIPISAILQIGSKPEANIIESLGLKLLANGG